MTCPSRMDALQSILKAHQRDAESGCGRVDTLRTSRGPYARRLDQARRTAAQAIQRNSRHSNRRFFPCMYITTLKRLCQDVQLRRNPRGS